MLNYIYVCVCVCVCAHIEIKINSYKIIINVNLQSSAEQVAVCVSRVCVCAYGARLFISQSVSLQHVCMSVSVCVCACMYLCIYAVYLYMLCKLNFSTMHKSMQFRNCTCRWHAQSTTNRHTHTDDRDNTLNTLGKLKTLFLLYFFEAHSQFVLNSFRCSPCAKLEIQACANFILFFI